VLVMTGLSDLFDQPWMLTVTLWALAAASTVTVVQRAVIVRRQALAIDPPASR
jgi:CDP-diacylglycerol---glycerol-3-phosphate 3-phosphatidyltransferase